VSPRRGPELPYSVVAGVTPWRASWVVASAKVNGSTFAPETPKVYDSFNEVLEERPAFTVLVVNAPIGYRDRLEEGPRHCDARVRALLRHRGKTIHNAPLRGTLVDDAEPVEDHLDAVTMMRLSSYREVAAEMSPYRQRTIYEGNPELSFYLLNSDTPLLRSKRVEVGLDERRTALIKKFSGMARVLDANLGGVPKKHLLDAAALLWTARRVSARGARRLPVDPEWDSHGLRMEYVF
jgi:predicted RNase H-like nuclease